MQAIHDIHLIQLSDTHLRADPKARPWGCDNDAILVDLLDLARRQEPRIDGVLATGDLVDDGSVAGYRRLAMLITALELPLYWLPGNHDAPAVMADELRGAYLHPPGWYKLGGWQLITLDSHLPGQDAGQIDEQQMARLRERLHDSDAPALIAVHHHPVALGSAWLDALMLTNGEALLAELDRHPQVKAVLFGHVHQVFESQRRSLRLLACPAATRQFLPRSAEFAIDDRPAGYRWIKLGADGQIDTGIRRLEQASRLPASSFAAGAAE